MTHDAYSDTANSLITPAGDCFAITPQDTALLPRATKAIYVGIGGDLVVRPVESSADVTFRNVIAGSILDIRVKAVRATGTTAQDIVGLA
ncbi:MAG: hypothetical protein ACK4IS_11115 [Erythrobacter sp.]